MILSQKNKLDILLMVDNNIDTVGGEQESTKIIIDEFKNLHNIGLVQPGESATKFDKVSYFELSKISRIKLLIKKPHYFLKYILDAKEIINEHKPLVIHTQSQVSFFMVALLKKLRLISKDQYIIHTERGLYYKYNTFFKHLFFFFLKELNTLVTTTHLNKKYWKEALEKRNIHVDYQIVENTAGKIFETIDYSQLVNNQKVISIGFSGRYNAVKNWPLAIEISKKLNNQLNDKVHVYMAVGCLGEKEEKDVKAMFNEMHNILGDRFHGKINISLEEMNAFYYPLDVFVLTTKKYGESFGRTLVEAMSRHTAVLTTPSGGSVEVVGNKLNVFKTADEFVEKIITYDNNRNILEEEKKNNMVRVKELYSLRNNIDKYSSLYKSIVSENKKGSL